MRQSSNVSTELVSTGVAGLDDVLIGGFPRGHFFLIEGEPGTGKTTLRIVERYGGRIWATSQVGHGATFYFALPAATPA